MPFLSDLYEAKVLRYDEKGQSSMLKATSRNEYTMAMNICAPNNVAITIIMHKVQEMQGDIIKHINKIP